MKLAEVKEILQLESIVDGNDDLKIETVCGADLMSDVLAFSQQKTLLLTGLTNPQVVRTAEMIELKVIIFVRGKRPLQETIDLAKEKDICLFVTTRSLFESCGLLYINGLKPEKMEELK